MKKFVYSLSTMLLIAPVVMAQQVNGTTAAASALQTLATWATPAIESLAILILIIGIVAAAFELFKRSIGWAIGLFIGASVLFAVLWGMATPIGNVLCSMTSAVGGSCTQSSSSNNNG